MKQDDAQDPIPSQSSIHKATHHRRAEKVNAEGVLWSPQISEQALDSTSSQTGTITISLPGLPDGVNVTRNRDNFYVNDGHTLLERNEVRVSAFPCLCFHLVTELPCLPYLCTLDSLESGRKAGACLGLTCN